MIFFLPPPHFQSEKMSDSRVPGFTRAGNVIGLVPGLRDLEQQQMLGFARTDLVLDNKLVIEERARLARATEETGAKR